MRLARARMPGLDASASHRRFALARTRGAVAREGRYLAQDQTRPSKMERECVLAAGGPKSAARELSYQGLQTRAPRVGRPGSASRTYPANQTPPARPYAPFRSLFTFYHSHLMRQKGIEKAATQAKLLRAAPAATRLH